MDRMSQIRLDIAMNKRVKERTQADYQLWRNTVLRRDKWRCQICWAGKQSGLEAHHMEAYLSNPELRTTVSNGVTLCKSCHQQFHRLYGQGGNTKEQFIDFQTKKKKRSFDQ